MVVGPRRRTFRGVAATAARQIKLLVEGLWDNLNGALLLGS